MNTKALENIQVKKDSYEVTITSDVCLFAFIDGSFKILLLQRNIGSFKGSWMLPGGIMEENETIKDCAKKVLRGLIAVEDVHMSQVKAYTNVNRHPVKRVVTISFYALIKPENHPTEQKLDVTEIKWFSINELQNIGFDHHKIIKDAHKLLKHNLENNLIFGELLPDKFTLNELQTLYESILEENFDRRNFRKKIFQLDVLENTGKIKKGVKGGPFLYKRRKKAGAG